MKIDWKLLREQKARLLDVRDVQSEVEDAEILAGVARLLGAIQNGAVDSGEATAVEVFGGDGAHTKENWP